MQDSQFPKMIRVKQQFNHQRVSNISHQITRQIKDLSPNMSIKPGQTVAVACSSRGLTDYPEIVKAIVDNLKKMKLMPFLVPAMGSHGAGTAAGQERVLLHLGLTKEAVGAKIRSSLDVVEIGKTKQGIPVMVDRFAFEADHIVLINRIKKHTDFMGEFESGLMKLMVIGLGKIAGAGIYHQAMMSFGSSNVIAAGARHVLSKCNILFGVATIENGYGDVADVGVFPASEIEQKEKVFFKRSMEISPKLPVDEADIILIDEIGKEISGAGFDTRVVGRIRLPGTPEPEKPSIKRIILSDITKISEGNACGFGLADIITRRLGDKVDQNSTDTNTIVSMALEMGKTPLIMPNDKEALALAMRCIGFVPTNQIKIIRIKNTLCLSEVDLSQAYTTTINDSSNLEIILQPRDMVFDTNGYFPEFFSMDETGGTF
ncbi:MAG: DUF2088 domain-containing protein [Desulfobacula sp.]|jgi:hypothetical protein|uniref:lactate racemase domain-containing protein n=2 Tax=Desulfobacula sp. TaxID=2593537 RepID=UPI001DBBAAC6|nr:DUF2088 domain-containing protein [Desulfobacula sp.]MBT3485325.1 DUF2088 domain-containing protein [Desulfobacula sp.]MBT3803615.1 DUF2088 domain-containing protein [Desulfobacula sp.]MBT4024190.1 DUF2088 domain-containing protein [Desulfobacula sp.]MBT4199334.1 DUF2088 domain-containing protein [Desulfobacula sp.]